MLATARAWVLAAELPAILATIAVSYARWFERVQQSVMAACALLALVGPSIALSVAPPTFSRLYIALIVIACIVPAYVGLRLRLIPWLGRPADAPRRP